ncbi:ATP-binding protein [Shumkonia mesophila]|uniref:ATP-binding protein n=1 Tax=Shumkonia mesophila TaxID=2838854 RepID=UPI002934969B|nr:ATP-binding protein [Shumkonia mesophila]
MPEITVISGKGGTGKTTVTAAFVHLAGNAVLCDLDVDAPDLPLILRPTREVAVDFRAGHVAVIDPSRCNACGFCMDICRFGAIVAADGEYAVNPLACEGCKACVALCPAGAIDFPVRRCGRRYRSQTRFGPLIHAQLFPGAENSGLLVSELRREARELAVTTGRKIILSDGAPGIGCPVISSLTGTQLAVLVTEPTPSGRHDLERVAELTARFEVPAAVILNKADLGGPAAGAVREACAARGLPIIAEIPYDPGVTAAMVAGQTVTEAGIEAVAAPLRAAWSAILELTAARRAA